MQHFFIEPSQAEGEWIRLNGSDVNHMKPEKHTSV